jgi:hypothetical protein
MSPNITRSPSYRNKTFSTQISQELLLLPEAAGIKAPHRSYPPWWPGGSEGQFLGQVGGAFSSHGAMRRDEARFALISASKMGH